MAVKKKDLWPGESRDPVDPERLRIAARWLSERPPTPREGSGAGDPRLLVRGPTDLRERLARAGWQRATRPATPRSSALGAARAPLPPPVVERRPPIAPEILPEVLPEVLPAVAASVPALERIATAVEAGPEKGRKIETIETIDWTPAISVATAARDALVLLGSAVLRSLRAAAAASSWLGRLLGRWLMAAIIALGHAVLAVGHVLGRGAVRVSGATVAASIRMGQAAWRSSAAAGAALRHSAATAGAGVARTVPRGWHALDAALRRAGSAARGRASSAAAGARASVVTVADRSVAAGARVVTTTRLRAWQGGRFAWRCVSLPPVLAGRAATAASRAVIATVARTGRAVVTAPRVAVRGVRAGVAGASARLTAVVLFRRIEKPAREDQRIDERTWEDGSTDEAEWEDVEEICDHERAGRAAICPECGEPLVEPVPARGRLARFAHDLLVAFGHLVTTVVFALLAVGIVVASILVGAAIIAH